MSVWLTIPSARPKGGTAQEWKSAGYKIALCRDQEDDCLSMFSDGLVIVRPYAGYAASVNLLVRTILKTDPSCQWVVAGGDDTLPDPTHSPEQIETELEEHFAQNFWKPPLHPDIEGLSLERISTFGVMQPTGDRWADGSIDRICGSPWMGREFCERVYGGKGPMFEGYYHMWIDVELQAVAQKLGCFLQRPDLVHRHEHFCRKGDEVDWGIQPPAHLLYVNSPQHWAESTALFETRKAAGYPGYEPC